MWRRAPRIFVPTLQHDRENLTAVPRITTKKCAADRGAGIRLPGISGLLAGQIDVAEDVINNVAQRFHQKN
jgi:hypothetical protein